MRVRIAPLLALIPMLAVAAAPSEVSPEQRKTAQWMTQQAKAWADADPSTKWSKDCSLDEADVRFFVPDVAVIYGAESKTAAKSG